MRLLSSQIGRDLRRGLVDPDFVGWRRGDGAASREALRVSEERGVEDGGTALQGLSREAVVHVVRRAEAEGAQQGPHVVTYRWVRDSLGLCGDGLIG